MREDSGTRKAEGREGKRKEEKETEREGLGGRVMNKDSVLSAAFRVGHRTNCFTCTDSFKESNRRTGRE